MFKWQLINDSITQEDKSALIDHINIDGVRFTQGGLDNLKKNGLNGWE